MDNYIIFNKGNSLEMGFKITSYDIGSPTPKITTENVPYMNGEYDFSTLNGVQYYNSRTITIEFSFYRYMSFNKDLNKSNIYMKYFEFKNFLYGSGKSLLDISSLLGINGTLNGICTNITGLEMSRMGGVFTVTFTCDPLINMGDFGDDLWNDFSFIDGISEINYVSVNGVLKIPVYNRGQKTNCSIETTGSAKIENYSDSFMIQTGLTVLDATGVGTVSIKFNKEMI
ncbi:MAG: hypothetical protein ACRDAU_02885 [Clostridium sp.]